MTQEEINAVLDRVRSWPREQQEQFIAWVHAFEEMGEGEYEPTEEERADIEAAHQEVLRGEFATDEQVKALFDKYR